jgi:hypothetical protein
MSEVIPPAVSRPEQWTDEEDDAPAQSWPAQAQESEAATSWRDRMDTAEYANLVPPPEPALEAYDDAEPPAVDEDAGVELPPVDPESGEDAGPPRGFDWG